jgi:hypothetical protein
MNESPFAPVVRTQSDVEQMWRRLMMPLGFGSTTLWMVMIEGERPLPRVLELDDMPDSPDEDSARALAGLLENLASPQLCCAFLRSRPGAGRPDTNDLAWAQTLYAAGRLAGVHLAVIHLAHDHDVMPLPMDDLVAESA